MADSLPGDSHPQTGSEPPPLPEQASQKAGAEENKTEPGKPVITEADTARKVAPDQSDIPVRKRGRFTIDHHLQIILGVIAFLGVLVALLVGFKDELGCTRKPNPCKALKKREEFTSKKIEELQQLKASCTDPDSIERYYDFKINFTTSELKDIKDSLNLCVD